MSEYLLPYSGREVLNKLQAIDDLMNNSGNNKDCDIAATASGNNFVITDSSESPLLNLKAEIENLKNTLTQSSTESTSIE